MNQNNVSRMYAAFGLAGQVGCFALIVAIGALVLGLWLDQTLGTRRTWTLVCVVVSVPINLFVTLRITQRLIARIIPPDQPKTELGPPSGEKSERSVDEDLR